MIGWRGAIGEDLKPRGGGFESWRQTLDGMKANLAITLNKRKKVLKVAKWVSPKLVNGFGIGEIRKGQDWG